MPSNNTGNRECSKPFLIALNSRRKGLRMRSFKTMHADLVADIHLSGIEARVPTGVDGMAVRGKAEITQRSGNAVADRRSALGNSLHVAFEPREEALEFLFIARGQESLVADHGHQLFKPGFKVSQDLNVVFRCSHIASRCRTGVDSAQLARGSRYRPRESHTALALGFLLPNGCLQQIAANRFSIPQDVIAILLQGFVRHAWIGFRVLLGLIWHNDEGAHPR
jgi:hypothetical protein